MQKISPESFYYSVRCLYISLFNLIALLKLIYTLQLTIVWPLLHSSTLFIEWTEIHFWKIMSFHLATAIKINLCAYSISNCFRLGGHVGMELT